MNINENCGRDNNQCVKIAYIIVLTNTDLFDFKSSGIKKKIDWQIDALSEFGIKVELIRKKMQPKWKRALLLQTSTIKWSDLKKEILAYDGLYHRHVNTDYQMLQLFRKIKKIKPEFNIILEIPTYPYEGERKKGILYYKDLFFRRYLKRYVDRIVIFDTNKEVWGIPSISTYNGIDLNSIRIKKQMQRSNGIDICMIADFEYWHGVDRLLMGLLNYYETDGKEDIRLHLVGGVSNLEIIRECKKIASCKLLKDKVFFYGNLIGEELDYIYDICHLAVASLGRHRTHIHLSSEIKTREYMGKGIPFIYSTEIDVFKEKHVDFAYQIHIDDSPVNINEVITFYKKLLSKYSAEQLSFRIREYAEDSLSMNKVMKPIADFFLSI